MPRCIPPSAPTPHSIPDDLSRLAGVLASVLALTACQESPASVPPEDATAPFAVVYAGPVGVSLALNGRPLQGALVTIRLPAERGSGVVGLLRTNTAGEASTVLSLDVADQEVDVVVTYPGGRGAWTDEDARQQLGALAPSMVQRHRVADLAELELALTEVPR